MTDTTQPGRTIGLGCMRLSTRADRDDERGVAVIRAALDAGATLLDTADSYCLDERDVGHNERLIARALAGWAGDRGKITVATKGGMRRPNGAWVPDGRAKHLRDACDASRRALAVDTIDLYQLHAVDPRTPIETSVRALARLQEDGKIRDVGLCNVTVSQIRAAQSVVPIASVQVSLSPFDDESLRNGVAEYCRDNGIRLIAYRPLGGERVKQLARDAVLSRIAAKHAVSNEELALAWLMSFGAGIVPIPGATRISTASSLARALGIDLDDEDRSLLDTRFSGRLLRVPRAERPPSDDADGDVVIVMGMPGAGKTAVACALESEGYQRLNRDAHGGSLADLASRLDELLVAGDRRIVLDNTYPTRKSRNEVIETAWQRGVPVRCIWLTTDVANAQINSIGRMLDVHGALPTPDEIRQRSKRDTRYLLPDAQFRYERTLEPPTVDEGFKSVETRDFVREPVRAEGRALILDFDDLVGRAAPVLRPDAVAVEQARRDTLARHRDEGWLLFVHAWRPQVERDETTLLAVNACFARMREVLGAPVDIECCPHDAGPPVCWCRKPIPGSVLEFASRRGVALARSIVVGASAADRTMAERIGARFEPCASFFADPTR
jgi:aryl-alcohol dehydrogenase-like predicted oxidoreductase/histidinol phosphatase-like enzyme/predicted kinase